MTTHRDGNTAFAATETTSGKRLDIRNGDYEEIWDVTGLARFLAVNFPDAIIAAGWTPPIPDTLDPATEN